MAITTILRSAVREINARDYATTADLQAAINALAADAARITLYVPKGTLDLAAALEPVHNLVIQGDGPGRSVLRAAPGLTIAVVLGRSASALQNVTLRGLSIDGNAANLTGNVRGVQVTNGAGWTLEWVEVRNTRDMGVLLAATPDSRVSRCTIDGTGQGGISGHGIQLGNGSHRGEVSHTRIRNVSGMGVRVAHNDAVADAADAVNNANGSTDVIVANNQIEKHASVADSLNGDGSRRLEAIGVTVLCNRAKIDGNSARFCGDNGISISAAASAVTGNTCDSNRYHGIQVGPNAAGTVVTGNVCTNNNQHGATDGLTRAGIHLNGVARAVVVGNRCTDTQAIKTQDFGIKGTLNELNCVVTGNSLEGNKTRSMDSLQAANNYLGANPGHIVRGGGRASVANGGTIAHGLATTPLWAVVSAEVPGHIAVCTGRSATDLTIGLWNHDGTLVTVAEPVHWYADAGAVGSV